MTTMSLLKMVHEDPWATIESPMRVTQISARRIPNAGNREFAFYWGIDSEKHCLLVLQLNRENVARPKRLPTLKGLTIDATDLEHGTGERIIIRLTDTEQRDVFYRFCIDLVNATKIANTADDAVSRFLTRAWRWHRLLRFGSSGLLSDIEQRGLIGELRVIERCLLEISSVQTVIEGWTGPLGAPKDFKFGLVAIEAKTYSPERAEIIVSSLDQLDALGETRLFLSVTEIATATNEKIDSITVTDLAARIKQRIANIDPSVSHIFDERLASTGFDWLDDYSDKRWIIGGVRQILQIITGQRIIYTRGWGRICTRMGSLANLNGWSV